MDILDEILNSAEGELAASEPAVSEAVETAESFEAAEPVEAAESFEAAEPVETAEPVEAADGDAPAELFEAQEAGPELWQPAQGELPPPAPTDELAPPPEPRDEMPLPQAPTDELWPKPQQARADDAPPHRPTPPKPEKRRPGIWLWLLIGLAAGLLVGFLIGMTVGRTIGGAQLRIRSGSQSGEAPFAPQIPDGPGAANRPDGRPGEGNDAAGQPEGSLLDRIPQTNQERAATVPSTVYQQNVNAVVGIYGESASYGYWGGSATSAGTGFILTEDGYVLTNYHVVKGCDSLTVELYDKREFPAELIGYEAGTSDLALLKIDASGLQTVTLGDSDSATVGEMVCAIGNPLGRLTHSLTVGYLSAKDRYVSADGTTLNMLQTDCVVNAGNSGGPLFNMNGEVIGITTAKYGGMTGSGTTIEGIGFAIPINDVKPLLDDLRSHGRVQGRPYLGITVQTELPAGDYPAGVYVTEVNAGSCAEKAGLKPGDVITRIGGDSITDYDGLSAVLKNYSAGDPVQITVWRGGESLTLHGTLDERPADPSAG